MRALSIALATTLALTSSLTSSPVSAQLVGGGSSNTAPASTGGSFADLSGSWGGVLICGTSSGRAFFLDVAEVGSRVIAEMRVYGEQSYRIPLTVTETEPNVFELIEQPSGWNYRVSIENDEVIGTAINGPQDCRLRLLRTLGGFDQ